MKNKFKSFIVVIVVAALTIINTPLNASALSKEMAFSNPEKEGIFWVEGGDYSDNSSILYSTTQKIGGIGVNYYLVHLRNDGTAWYLYDNILKYYNFYVFGANMSTEIPAVAIYDDSSGNAYCYKTPSGEYYYLPSFENMKNEYYVTEKVTAGDIPKEPTPTKPPTATSKPTSTKKPQDPMITGGTSTKVKKSGSSVKVTQDGEVVSSVTFNKKKGFATFKVKNKNKKVKKVKQAFIIGKSYNYGYITKANKFKTINRKTGKVKTYSGKWKKATIKKNVAINVVKLKGGKKKAITGF